VDPSPKGLPEVLGSDNANEKTRFSALDVQLDLLRGWCRMAAPLECATSSAGDVSPRVPEPLQFRRGDWHTSYECTSTRNWSSIPVLS